MKYGYMAGFRAELESEIKFAKKHFDFVEITLKPKSLDFPLQHFSALKNSLKNFEVIGHIHWEIKDFEKIYKNIKVLKKLGVKKITIHPFLDEEQTRKENIQNNIFFLSKINEFCLRNRIELLIENITNSPFNKASNLAKLIDNIPNVGMTLDIGHANKTSKSELSKFLKNFKSKIKHIHIHDNIGKFDHLFFNDPNRLKRIFTKIKSINYNGTILLETFAVIKNNQYVSLDFSEIKNRHIKQLEMVKKI